LIFLRFDDAAAFQRYGLPFFRRFSGLPFAMPLMPLFDYFTIALPFTLAFSCFILHTFEPP